MHQWEVQVASVLAYGLALHWQEVLGEIFEDLSNIFKSDRVAIQLGHCPYNELVANHKKDVVCTDAGRPAKHELEILYIIHSEATLVVAFVHHQNLSGLFELARQIHILTVVSDFQGPEDHGHKAEIHAVVVRVVGIVETEQLVFCFTFKFVLLEKVLVSVFTIHLVK